MRWFTMSGIARVSKSTYSVIVMSYLTTERKIGVHSIEDAFIVEFSARRIGKE